MKKKFSYDPALYKDEIIYKKVANAISKVLDVSKEEIKPSSSLYYDLGADSLDMVEVSMEVEKALNITISDESYIDNLEKNFKVSDFVSLVKQYYV